MKTYLLVAEAGAQVTRIPEMAILVGERVLVMEEAMMAILVEEGDVVVTADFYFYFLFLFFFGGGDSCLVFFFVSYSFLFSFSFCYLFRFGYIIGIYLHCIIN